MISLFGKTISDLFQIISDLKLTKSEIIFRILLLSGKICLFILENTNFTNNTNPCGVLSLLIAYEPKVAQAIARIPSGWHSCYSPLIKKYSFRMEIDLRDLRFVLFVKFVFS